jgi:hypothetical protein
MAMVIVGSLILLLGAILIVKEIEDAMYGIGCTIFLLMGVLLMIMGSMEDIENDAMKEHNINPAVIEYIVDVRNQKDETSITTDNAIAIYIECKRNGLSEEEAVSFLLPDITKEEAKSIVKTYNLLGKEN